MQVVVQVVVEVLVPDRHGGQVLHAEVLSGVVVAQHPLRHAPGARRSCARPPASPAPASVPSPRTFAAPPLLPYVRGRPARLRLGHGRFGAVSLGGGRFVGGLEWASWRCLRA